MHKFNHITLDIHGVNLKRLIKTLYKNKIDIFHLVFLDHKNLEITINYNNLKNIKPLLKDYNYKIKSRYGLNFFKNYLFSHLGLIVGAVCFIVILFLNSNFLSQIYITGNSRISNNEIISFLGQQNIKANTFFNTFDINEIENKLESNFDDISLVSVIKKGTNLIINIKEKIYVEDVLSRTDIICGEDGKILELNVIQGTSNYKVGDSVKKGDILVNGYNLVGESKVECKAIANIKMQVWYSSSITFNEEEVITKKTGKVISNSYFQIFNKKFLAKTHKVDFKNYIKEEKTQYLFNNLIVPIKLYTQKFYEIEEILQKNDFSSQKDAIIEKAKLQAQNLVPTNLEVINKIVEIQDVPQGKIVSVYLETIQELS